MTTAEKLVKVAENREKLYEAGKQAEYDAFWDSYQDNGNRNSYIQGFRMWNDSIFYPKYDLKPIGDANNMFYACEVEDIDRRLKDCGVTLDTSEATSLTNIFASVRSRVVPEVSFVNSTSLQGAYGWSNTLTEIKGIILRNDGTNTIGTAFRNAYALEKLFITGVVGSDFDIQYSPLSKASFTNIVDVLSTTATGKTVYFNKTAKQNAFTDAEWAALIATKQNWTFMLV